LRETISFAMSFWQNPDHQHIQQQMPLPPQLPRIRQRREVKEQILRLPSHGNLHALSSQKRLQSTNDW